MRVDAETMGKEFYEARNPSMKWSALTWWEKLHMAVLAERERCCAIVHGMAGSDNVAHRTVKKIREGQASSQCECQRIGETLRSEEP